jgi:prepilin-type N-terminal cleavage/methylation domain-containing protein
LKPLRSQLKKGFTLLELMIAMVLMVIAMSIAFQAFSGTIQGWKRGTEMLDAIKHGDFAMTQLVSAVNSTIYFYNTRKTYAFKYDKSSSGGLPADTISFVTTSSAFMPVDSPYFSGPHRIKLFIDVDEGEPALFAIAMPAIANDEEFEEDFDTEPLLVSRAIQGLEILFWDKESEDWTEEWEPENAVPERILLTIFMASDDKNDDPIEFSRTIEIPVAPSVKEKLTGPSSTGNTRSSSGTSGSKSITVGQPK